MKGLGGPSCAAREQFGYPDTELPFLSFGSLVLMLKVEKVADRGTKASRGHGRFAAAGVASLGTAVALSKFPLFLLGKFSTRHAAEAGRGMLHPLGQSAEGNEVLLNFREGSMC